MWEHGISWYVLNMFVDLSRSKSFIACFDGNFYVLTWRCECCFEQMERTVEIDENSEILKDLERLRSVSMDQQVGSSGEEASPGGGSPDGLPTFALQGGNPLEQLGLFMKDDEDEDEHHEEETGGEIEKVQSVLNKVVDANGNGQVEVDVEEGEID